MSVSEVPILSADVPDSSGSAVRHGLRGKGCRQRAKPAHQLSTWRSTVPLYAGMAQGPFYITDLPGEPLTLWRSDGIPMGEFPVVSDALARMSALYEQWQIDRQPWVYFIGSELKPRALIKIGTTVNVERRLKELQPGSPTRLKIFAKVRGGYDVEASYHARWARFRQHNEWFRLTPKLCAEIAALAS